ncbi:MAG: Hsp20/alpha crystallin family protein [Kastovskya adunca ATA6-11-RM4]|nr:Hsp20/alpha crystallin family protein [Kastovskya adunca ATA6-11-RM4]
MRFPLLSLDLSFGIIRRCEPDTVAVQNDKVQADFTNGILTLTLPKVESVQNRVVKLNLGQEAIEPSNQAQEDKANQPAAV